MQGQRPCAFFCRGCTALVRSGGCYEMKGNLVSLGVLPHCTLQCWICWVGPHPHRSEALAPWRAVHCRPGGGKLSAVNLWMQQTPHLPLARWTSPAHMYSGSVKVRLMLMRLDLYDADVHSYYADKWLRGTQGAPSVHFYRRPCLRKACTAWPIPEGDLQFAQGIPKESGLGCHRAQPLTKMCYRLDPAPPHCQQQSSAEAAACRNV